MFTCSVSSFCHSSSRSSCSSNCISSGSAPPLPHQQAATYHWCVASSSSLLARLPSSGSAPPNNCHHRLSLCLGRWGTEQLRIGHTSGLRAQTTPLSLDYASNSVMLMIPINKFKLAFLKDVITVLSSAISNISKFILLQVCN